MTTTILDIKAYDIRFPTSRTLDGSDAMNTTPDYSAAYVIIETDHPEVLLGMALPLRLDGATRSVLPPSKP